MSLKHWLRSLAVMIAAIAVLVSGQTLAAAAAPVGDLKACSTTNVSVGEGSAKCIRAAKQALGFTSGNFDRAIRDYQTNRGILPATGNIGPRTWASFIAEANGVNNVTTSPSKQPKPQAPPTTSCDTQVLRFNQSTMYTYNRCVEELQKLLNAAGYHPTTDKIDGKGGRRTFNGLANFKSSQQLARNDVVDAATWKALRAPKPLPPNSCTKYASKGPKVICQNEARQMIYAYENGNLNYEIPARFGGLAYDHSGQLVRYSTATGVNRKVVEKYESTSMGGWGTMNNALRTNWAYAFIHAYTPTAHPNDNGHGCVNVLNRGQAQTLYNWASVGTLVYNRKF